MSFIVNNRDYEGKTFNSVFPYIASECHQQAHLIKKIVEHLEAGKFIHVEFTHGARAGTIARWDISAKEMADLYQTNRTVGGDILTANTDIKLVFDDRDNVIVGAIRYGDGIKGIVHFNLDSTKWVFTTTKREKVEPKVIFDHFGVKLEVGQLVMAPVGISGNISTRFGHITAITPAGTIKIKTFKTRRSQTKNETNLSPTVSSCDVIVIDKERDLLDQVLLAKIAHG
jgi:hypothetical protein